MSIRLKASLGWSFPLLVALSAPAQVAETWTGSHDMNASQINGTTRATLIERHPAGGVVATCIVNGLTVINKIVVYADLGVSLVRWSNAGDKLWVRPLVSPNFRIASALAVDAQGTSYVAGQGDSGFQVITVDASGSVAWTWTSPGAFDMVWDLDLTPAGDVIAVGTTGFGTATDMLAQTLSASGQPLWTTTIDGPLAGDDYARAVAVDGNGESFLAGTFSKPSVFEVEIGVCRLDANGDLLWKQALAGPPEPWTSARGITLAPNGDPVVFGSIERAPYIARLDATGSLLWEQTWGPNDGLVFRTRFAADGSLWSGVSHFNNFTFNNFISLLHHSADGSLLGSFDYDPSGVESTLSDDFVFGTAGQIFLPLTVTTPTSRQGVLLQVDGSGTSSLAYPFEATPPSATDDYERIAVLDPTHLAVTGTTSLEAGGLANVRAFDVSDSPGTYCVAMTNSAGCQPALSSSGFSSSGATGGFTVVAGDELNQALGMFIYSLHGSAQQPFQGGTLCVQPPVRRTPTQSSGGTSMPTRDCSGSYLLDLNAFAQGLAGGNPSPALLVPGTGVWMQAWGRDKGSPPFHKSHSNGLSYVVLP